MIDWQAIEKQVLKESFIDYKYKAIRKNCCMDIVRYDDEECILQSTYINYPNSFENFKPYLMQRI